MAQNGVELDPEKLSCSICVDLLKDPVTIPCGHSYCMDCIERHWALEDHNRIYSCPQCWKAFKPRPQLEKNVMLAALVEDLKKTRLQAAAAAGPEDVSCDVCMKRKMKAVKSCLVCMASYCTTHLQPHYDSPPLKKHKLTGPSKNLQENICSRHNEVKKLFCCTDQQLICYLCSVEEHKGHNIVSAEAERTERRKQLEVSQQNIQQRIQDREKDVVLLQQEVEAINSSADKAVKKNEKTFSELNCLIQKRSSEVKQQIRSQQKTKVRRVKELQEKLKQEISDLKKKDAEMQQLLSTEDLTQFLHNYHSELAVHESTPSSSINIRPRIRFETMTAAVSEFSNKVQDFLKNMWTRNPPRAVPTEVLPPQPEPESESEPEPKTRTEFFKYCQDVTLDPNTADNQLVLSQENRKVTIVKQPQPYPDHPDRFTENFQVLSKECLTGRCYWEVDLKGSGVIIAVSYKENSRGLAPKSAFGQTEKSWALSCCSAEFVHKNDETPLPSKIGVYLDHTAGLLSFYRVSETMTLLHKVQTTFTEPLHAGVQFLYYESSAEFIKLR